MSSDISADSSADASADALAIISLYYLSTNRGGGLILPINRGGWYSPIKRITISATARLNRNKLVEDFIETFLKAKISFHIIIN